ncbi:hypothetical protein SLEP1_g14698 [Rubroshorea leprosula]|uniref:Uncharacterized protein n=1 Tax=Rubroshorea leprosula TaxID=152421 RepID=A0AAV5IJX4_9ROSI|nr:hypothetical protein SLEP1_g14698 [Rubroshorea leprosula]
MRVSGSLLNTGTITDACQWELLNTGTTTVPASGRFINAGHDL